MAYSKQTWSSNELITADKLNHIEDGIPTKTSQLSNDSGFLTSHQSLTGKKNTQSAVSSPAASGTAVAFIDTISQDAQGVISPTKKTVQSASQSAAGLMSAADKTKLDGIATGAQVNSITGVKGDAESSYRTGNINLTPANIGAVTKTGDTINGNLIINGNLAVNADGNIDLTSDYDVTIGDADAKIVKHSDGTIHMQSSGDASMYITNGGNAEIRSDSSAASIILTPNGDVNVSGDVALDSPLLVTSGGTGATTAANARANLEITPANIGAVATTTVIDIPHGGTGATTPAQARTNLGLTPSASQMIATGIYVVKVGNLAFINCDGDNAIALSPKTWVTLGYLPNGYVPAGHFYGIILNGSQADQSGIIHIMDSGTIQYFNSGTAQATALWGSMIFPISNN